MKLTKGIKKLNTENGDTQTLLAVQESRKIIITVNKKKVNGIEKAYYSYQLNIPRDYLFLVQDNFDYSTKHREIMYLIELDQQNYVIKTALYGTKNIESLVNVNAYINPKEKRNVQYTLPKKDMVYLQAYEKYQQALKQANDEIAEQNKKISDEKEKKELYKRSPLVVNLSLMQKIHLSKMEIRYELYLNLDTNIGDRFKNYVLSTYENVPTWFKILNYDWKLENDKKEIESLF